MNTERAEQAPRQAYAVERAAGDLVDAWGEYGPAVQSFLGWLAEMKLPETANKEHGDVEQMVLDKGRTVENLVLQGFFRQKAHEEVTQDLLVGADGLARAYVERGHTRPLTSLVGPVEAERMAYRSREKKANNLYPLDAELNLPEEKHSHGLRRLAAIESARGSFGEAAEAITRQTAVQIGKRQVEELAAAAAVDVEAFYETTKATEASPDADPLVLSMDGKGVKMRSQDLRPGTRKAAEGSEHKLQTRLSRGEKKGRKRMAEVGAVYDSSPKPRVPTDIIHIPQKGEGRKTEEAEGKKGETHIRQPAPTARGKWLTVSVVEDADVVIQAVFDEAERRDPDHHRPWVVLADGNNDQIKHVLEEAEQRKVDLSLLVDFVHVIEYLWKAAWSFFEEGDPDAETWVAEHALRILEGNSHIVARAIGAKATRAGLSGKRREGADKCVRYLTNKRPYLNYPKALQEGWPIATGVIEGACRYLVKDRMDRTGARWGLQGAESILRLRAVITNGDFDVYWRFHLEQERRRVHDCRYLRGGPQ